MRLYKEKIYLKRFFIFSIASFFALPSITFAVEFDEVVVFFIEKIVNPLIIFIIGLATVYFIWGVAKYILHSGDAKAREDGRSMMIYGILALFVMVSMWGLVNLLGNTFNLDNRVLPTASQLLN